MIATPTPAQPTAPQLSAFQDDPGTSQAVNLLTAMAVQDFAFSVNAGLIAALAAQGQDLSSMTLQRRLRAYAEPRVTAPVKLSRCA